MKRLIYTLLLFTGSITLYGNPATDSLVARILGKQSDQITTRITRKRGGKEHFEIKQAGNKIAISGSSATAVGTGLNWYLKYVAGVHMAWNNLTPTLPKQLPAVKKTIRKETNITQRYYLNYCTYSYSMAFWDWERWQKEIDWMALHGVNLVLSLTGNDVVWHNTLKQLGYSTQEINEFIAGPAFQAWWMMNNLEGWGGPNPEAWYQRQEILQKKILARLSELDIEPVLPGYSGMIPSTLGKKLGYNTLNIGDWCSFNRPHFLPFDDPHFDTVADLYYQEMEKLYGKANYYSMDPFHEGGYDPKIDLKQVGKTLLGAMKRTSPSATWVVQAWQDNPRAAMVEEIKEHDLLVLDLQSDTRPQWGDPRSVWYRPEGYGKHDWAYCLLLNFGANVGFHGKINRLIDGYYLAKEHPNGKTLTGVGVTAEGIENNPIMYELLYELPWRTDRFTQEEWLPQILTARYGKHNKATEEAWGLLAATVYNAERDKPGEGTVESLLCGRPSFDKKAVSTWGGATLFYDPDTTRLAAKLMLSAADDFRGNNNFEYDLVDIVRQSLADRANTLYDELRASYQVKDAARFDSLSQTYLNIILQQDRLLATRSEFLTGTWIEQAKKAATTPEEAVLYEWNARSLITTWGPIKGSEAGGLHDYSHREWSGILSTLYYQRWKIFFDSIMMELNGATPRPIDFFAIEETWARDTTPFDTTPKGDPIDIAREVYHTVFP